MQSQDVEKLQAQYTDKYVSVDARRPELARFANRIGQVKTINFSGRALVQFQGADRAWYDLDLSVLTVVDPPAPPAASAAKKAAT